MDRLRGLASLLLLLAIVFAALRLLHVGVPLLYPRVLQGPFALDAIEEAEEYTGFPPVVPFYRPESLGSRPVAITATRGPRPALTVFWQADRFLVLVERRGGDPPVLPATALRLPDDEPEARWWREGRTLHLATRRGEVWIEVRTDLPQEDLHRLLRSLVPVSELD